MEKRGASHSASTDGKILVIFLPPNTLAAAYGPTCWSVGILAIKLFCRKNVLPKILEQACPQEDLCDEDEIPLALDLSQ